MRPWQLRSRDAQQVDGPVQFGVVLPRGAFFDGGVLPCVGDVIIYDADVQCVASHDDGSIALARVVLRSWTGAPGQSLSLEFKEGSALPGVFDPCADQMLNAYSVSVDVVDAAQVHWIAGVSQDQSWQVLRALTYAKEQGDVRRTVEFGVPLRAINDHPQLRARFRFTAYSGHPGALCEVSVENVLVDAGRPVADLPIASVTVIAGGYTIATRGAHLLEHGTLWRSEGWLGKPAPDVVVVPDGRDLADLMLCPDLDWGSPCGTSQAAALIDQLQKESQRGRHPSSLEKPVGAAGSPFPLYGYQPSSGDRADIGWVSRWTSALLNGGADDARDLQTWADCNGSGAFSVHYRSGDAQPLGIPHDHAFWRSSAYPSKKSQTANVAHHVTCGLWSWVLTVRERYFEELRCWSLLCVRDNYPNDGTLQNVGDRREAWALRSIAACRLLAPDVDSVREYLTDCLQRTARAWVEHVAETDALLPLGAYTEQTWRPSGRDQSPFCYVGSPWMGAWFTAMALATDRLLPELQGQLTVVARRGWAYLLNYLAPVGGAASFEPDVLADYSVPTVFYTPKLDAATGKWSVTPSSELKIATPQALAYAARVAQALSKPQLKASDMPENPNPLAQASRIPDIHAAYGGSQYHEYGPGRCGTHLVGLRVGLPSARELVNVIAPLSAARAEATHVPAYQQVKEST